jgi:hypothetical protein
MSAFHCFKIASALLFSYVVVFCVVPLASMQTAPAPPVWAGWARCQIDIQGPGYTERQTHTWAMSGGGPSLEGAFRIYPATWSVVGAGSLNRTQGNQTLTAQWAINGMSANAPIAVFVRASDGRMFIQTRHAQMRAAGAVAGYQQLTIDGKPQRPAQISSEAFEWSFPVVEVGSAAPTANGSSSPAVTGSVGFMQPGGSRATSVCNWQFGQGASAPAPAQTLAAVPVPVAPVVSSGGPGPQPTSPPSTSTATATTTPVQVTTTSPTQTATGTLANEPLGSGSVGSSRTGTALNTATDRVLALAPRTITLAGFTAAGTSTAVAPRTITLAGFTAAGTATAVAPHTITLPGWTSAGP